MGRDLTDFGNSIISLFEPKIQVVIYGTGGVPVIEGDEPADDKETIPVDMKDFPTIPTIPELKEEIASLS